MASLNRSIEQLFSDLEGLASSVDTSESKYTDDPAALFAASGVDAYPWQIAALESPARRQILNCSRQSGKTATGAAKAMHTCLYTPNSTILLISPALRQSGTIYLKTLSLYRAIGAPLGTTKLSADETRFSNGSRLLSLPGSPDTIRGFTPDLIIVDEAARTSDALYHSLRPMLAASGGSIWALSTPSGRRGWFFKEWSTGSVYSKSNAGGWKKTRVTASECPHISPEDVEADRASIGDAMVRQEYFCEFIEGMGSFFRAEDISKMFTGADIEPLFEAYAPNWTDSSIEALI